MPTLTEQNISYTKLLFDQFSIQQLIELATSSLDEETRFGARGELIQRGKEDVQNRIQIKKLCKAAIETLELTLQKINGEIKKDSNSTKLFKNRFLNTLSVLDKLQLEWQRFDLGLKHYNF